uniref:Uncharacterized protein n=1 Tax=Amphimedon queenslandica TaxID=400682 RepID=A0A1X7SEI3_AMPQE
MDNLQFLKKNDLKKLTIGYWILWEREGKEEIETEQLLEEKTSLKKEHQKEDNCEKKDNDEEQKASEAEKQLLLKRDGSAHA